MAEVLEPINSKTRISIFSQYNKTETDVNTDIEIILSWAKTQLHLPEIPTKNMITFFLVNNKFSVEITKQKLDMYYTIRTMFPDFYEHINPRFKKMKECFNSSYIFPLPKLVNNLDRVFFIKFKEMPENDFDVDGFIGKIVNVQEIRIQEDLTSRQYVLIDCKHLHLNQACKFTPMHGKIGATILEKVYSNRIKEIHVVNFHPIVNILLKLAKLVIKPKLIERIQMHESVESVKKFIPINVLPKEYGGSEASIDELQELWRKKFEEYSKRFNLLDSFKVDESKRLDTDKHGLEIYGTFKKLNLD